MASTSQEGNDTTNQNAAPSKYTAWSDLKSDGKAIMNQAVWKLYYIQPICMTWMTKYFPKEMET